MCVACWQASRGHPPNPQSNSTQGDNYDNQRVLSTRFGWGGLHAPFIRYQQRGSSDPCGLRSGSDCVLSNNCTPVGGVLFSFVVSENGDRIDGLSTDPLTVLSCILRRSSKDDQQARLLKAQPSLHHAPARQAEPTNIAKSAAAQVVLVAARAAKKTITRCLSLAN